MGRFTYLLGAGASAYRIPTVSTFVKGLEYVHQLLIERNMTSAYALPVGTEKEQEEILADITWLINETKSHATVDTFAKKLFLTKGEDSVEYKKVKHLLRFVLIIWQLDKDVMTYIDEERDVIYFDVDPRYDAFFSNIITKEKKIDERVSIISWNYDYQIEYSLYKFFPKNVASWAQLLPNTSTKEIDPKLFSKIAINGSIAKGVDEQLLDDIVASHKNSGTGLQERIAKYYNQYKKALLNSTQETLISYAWEERSDILDLRAKAKEILANTEFLMIIGYSFPNFNREVDKELLNAIKSGIKVIIQCPEKDFIQTRDRFLARLSPKTSKEIGEIKKYTQHSNDINEFHIHRMF